MWLTPPGPYKATTCREKELTLDHIQFLWPHKDMEGLPGRGLISLPVATSVRIQTWNTKHNIHASIHSNKTNMKWWLWRPNDIQGLCWPKATSHLSYGWGKTPKNVTQENCPDRGSNPGSLRDRSACYHLFHSDGHGLLPLLINYIEKISLINRIVCHQAFSGL